jgi:hypothetical protein
MMHILKMPEGSDYSHVVVHDTVPGLQAYIIGSSARGVTFGLRRDAQGIMQMFHARATYPDRGGCPLDRFWGWSGDEGHQDLSPQYRYWYAHSPTEESKLHFIERNFEFMAGIVQRNTRGIL